MKTLNYVVAFVVSVVLSVVAFGCADSDSPTAPSATTSTMAEAPSYVPSTSVRTTPASFDTLQPGTGGQSNLNAYTFGAVYDGRMLSMALQQIDMSGMRAASKPHRSRGFKVYHCPSEPRIRMQTCGQPIYSGSIFWPADTEFIQLPDIPMASCEGWIVTTAAELSDDEQNGWRNAPCPHPDSKEPVTSDGTGREWPEYPEPEREETEPEPTPEPDTPMPEPDTPDTPMPEPDTPMPEPETEPTPNPNPEPLPFETVQSNVAAAITAAGDGLEPGGNPVSVDVNLLFEGTEGTAGDEYRATSYDEDVVTVEVTANPRVVITPVGTGTTTIEVTFLPSGAVVEIDVTVAFAVVPVVIESGWDGLVGPISVCLVTGGTAFNFCYDGVAREIALLRAVGREPGEPRFGPGPGMGNPDNTATMGRQQAVVRYNAGPFAGWTTEQERRASALRYAGFRARIACEAEGGVLVQGSIEVFPAVNPIRLPGAVDGWEYTPNRTQTGYNYGARPAYAWRATCLR